MIKAVFFDMDGTVLDTFESWYQTMLKVLDLFKKRPISRVTFREDVWGANFEEIRRMYFRDVQINHLKESISSVFYEHINRSNLNPDFMEVWRVLKSRSIRTAILTVAPRDTAKKMLNYFGVLDKFDLILGYEDVKKSKPDPEIVQKALDRFGIAREEAIYTGDTDADMKAGEAAGVLTLKFGPNEKINKLSDVLEYIR